MSNMVQYLMLSIFSIWDKWTEHEIFKIDLIVFWGNIENRKNINFTLKYVSTVLWNIWIFETELEIREF